MKNSKIKKLFAVALTVALGMSTLVGCGGSGTSGKQELVYNLGAVNKTIDPALNNAVDGSTVIANAFEGLMRLDKNQKAELGVAKEYKVSDDGLTYTFTIKDDAKWSDGKNVEAKDFVYAWLRALDPATAAEYAYQLYYIKGAEAYNSGKGKKEDVAVKAVDEKTVEFTLAAPTPYFLELLAFPTYMPVREDIISADANGWALKPETYVSNGAFKMSEYNQKDSLVFVKNDNYWDKKNVKLDKLTFKMIEDETSAYVSLQQKQFDMTKALPTAEIQQGVKDGIVKISPSLSTYFFALNLGNNSSKLPADVSKALSNKEVRKAMNLAIDRKAIVENVTKANQIPAHSFVPLGIKGADGKEFSSKDYWKTDDNAANVAEAKKILAAAGYPDGQGLPTFELVYNTSEGHKAIAESVQQMWKAIGVNVNLVNQEWAVFQDTRKNGNFQIARHGWSGDYTDPMTFLDMWTTTSGQNDCKFANAEYDALIAKAKVEQDAAKRFEIMRQAEDILMAELPVLPVYYYTDVQGIQPYVKDVVNSPLGQVYFQNAYIDGK